MGYFFLGYHVVRSDFPSLLGSYSFLFVVYLIIYRYFSFNRFTYLLVAGILFRILLLFSSPNLSEDVYRFIWDGRFTASGMHSFSQTPAEIFANHRLPGLTEELFTKLNSKDYYTVYPPVLQFIFWCIAKIIPFDIQGSVVMLKYIIVIAECGIIWLLIKILKKLDLSPHLSLLYILNPLVVIELTGNAHVESVMILFDDDVCVYTCFK